MLIFALLRNPTHRLHLYKDSKSPRMRKKKNKCFVWICLFKHMAECSRASEESLC